MRTHPVPWLTISISTPLRRAMSWVDHPQVGIGDVDGHPLHGLAQHAVDLAGHDLRLAHGELEALASHGLDEDGQLQLAAALDLPGVGPLGRAQAQGDVAHQLGVEAAEDLPGRELRPVLAGEGRGVDAHGHGQARLVDGDDRQGSRVVGVGQGLADGDLVEPGHSGDLTRPGYLRLHPIEGVGQVELGDLGPLDPPVDPAPGHRVATPQLAVPDPADGQAPDIGRGIEVGHDGLQRCIRVVGGGGHVLGDGPEERLEVGAFGVGLDGGPPGPGVGVKDGEVDLALVGIEVEEELFDLVDDLLDAGVGPVHLVDDEHHRQAGLEGLSQHEPGLGQWPLRGVHQQKDAVDHGQAALDLPAKIGVPGRVDDVELDAAVADGRVLGQDGDAFLPLEVAGVEDALVDRLVCPKGP